MTGGGELPQSAGPTAAHQPAGGLPSAPRVSIVMPVYNGERFLPETLASVRAQTLTDWELLLVDDGSTDGSLAIARAAAERDPRVRLVQVEHGGVCAARNQAISLARAPLIAVWDADDLCAPERLEVQVEFLDANPDVGVLGSYAWHIGERGQMMGGSDFGPLTRDDFYGLKARHAPLFVTNAVFRAGPARAVGCYDPGMPVAQDVDLWTRMSDHTVVLALPRRLLAYRVHPGSASTRRFFEQMALTELIAANTARRRGGLSELTREDWARVAAGRSLRERLRRARVWRSRRLYRLAGGEIAAGRARGVAYLGLAAALAPVVVGRRLRDQFAPRRRGA